MSAYGFADNFSLWPSIECTNVLECVAVVELVAVGVQETQCFGDRQGADVKVPFADEAESYSWRIVVPKPATTVIYA